MGRVIVIGSGLAGLATAIRLGSSGHQALVFERAEEPGGSLGRVRLAEAYFDSEPSCLLLPQVLADLFASAGARLNDYIDLLPVQPAWRFVFPDHSTFDLGSDPERLREEVRRLSPGDARTLDRARGASRKAFHALSRGPWRRPLLGPLDAAASLLSPAVLFRLPWVLNPLRAARGGLFARWKDPRLRQAFGHLALELGSSAAHAPAAANWILFAATQFGSWYPRGGMAGLRRALLRLAEKLGVQLRCNESVGEVVIHAGAARGVITQEGRSVEAHAVVNTADPVSLSRFLIQKDSPELERFRGGWERVEPSFSRLGFLWMCSRDWPLLAHRTVFLSDNPEIEYDHLRSWRVAAPEPTVTVVHPAWTDADLVARGRSALTAWFAAPALSPRWRWSDEQRLAARESMLDRLEAAGLDGLAPAIVAEREIGPSTWRDEFGCHRGSCWGRATHSFAGLFSRYPNRHPVIKGLYFAGRWAHPGPTPSQIVLGARAAAATIDRDLAAPTPTPARRAQA